METTKQATATPSHSVTIVTKFLPPTNDKGSRILVKRGDGGNTKETRLTVSWDYEVGVAENHTQAIQQYLDHMGWGGTWITGSGKTGYTAVCVPQGGDQ